MPKNVNAALKANAKVKARTFEAKTKVIKLASRRLPRGLHHCLQCLRSKIRASLMIMLNGKSQTQFVDGERNTRSRRPSTRHLSSSQLVGNICVD